MSLISSQRTRLRSPPEVGRGPRDVTYRTARASRSAGAGGPGQADELPDGSARSRLRNNQLKGVS